MGISTPSTQRTTTHCYQTQSRLQCCSMRINDHYSNTYSRKHHNICTDQITGDYRVTASFTGLQAISSQQPRTSTDGHRSNMVQQRQRERRANTGAKESTTKAKAMEATGTTTLNNYKGGNGQGNHFKGQQGYGKGKRYSNKGKGTGYYNNQQGGNGAKGKHATNVCYRCGRPGHMAKQCRVAIYNCDTGNLDTNGPTKDWYSPARYDKNWHHQDQTQMQQLALTQPPQLADSSAVPISGLQEVTIAMIGTAQQHTADNKWVSLAQLHMYAHMVCITVSTTRT